MTQEYEIPENCDVSIQEKDGKRIVLIIPRKPKEVKYPTTIEECDDAFYYIENNLVWEGIIESESHLYCETREEAAAILALIKLRRFMHNWNRLCPDDEDWCAIYNVNSKLDFLFRFDEKKYQFTIVLKTPKLAQKFKDQFSNLLETAISLL